MHLFVRVASVRQEAEDIKSYLLTAEPGYTLPSAPPGSHIDVHIPGGIIRQYSLCNGPTDAEGYSIAVKRERCSRGGSKAMHESIAAGSRLEISAPKDHFPLMPGAAQYILVAGGIGITPLIAMLKHLCARGAPVQLHYFTRSPQATGFREFLATNYGENAKLYFGYDPQKVAVTLAKVLAAPRKDAHAYICGPTPLMECSFAAAEQCGWVGAQVHSEFFGARPARHTSAEAFHVRIRSTGATFPVAAGQTLLDALQQRGIDIDSACEQGICGTCLVKVLEGTLVHCDSYLTDEEKQSGQVILPCISRAVGTVELDL